jgi:hypothetical protein
MIGFAAFAITFVLSFLIVPVALLIGRLLGVYTIVQERRCHVYVLFGKVVEVIDEPGLHFLWPLMEWKALVVNWLGKCYVLDMRLDQVYLRSAPVNSEEGAPMGSGVLSFQKHGSSRLVVSQCREFHRPMPQQFAAGAHDGQPSRHELDRTRRSIASIGRVGLPIRFGIHSQSSFS